MKVDTHIHITPPDIIKNAEKWCEKEPYFKWLSASPQNKFVTGEQVVRYLDEAKFDLGIVFGFAFQDPALCKYVNDYTIEQVRCYPNKIRGYMVVSPRDKQLVYEVERCYHAGLRGIGEVFPEGQAWDLCDLQQTTPLKISCEQYHLPLLLHANETVGHDYVGKTTVPLKVLQTFIEQHSETPIILAHFGGGLLFYETMKELKQAFKHVYYDTAAAPFLYDPSIYRVAKEIGILDKILFGSDYPLLGIKRYEKELSTSGLTREEIDGVLGGHYHNLFK